MERLYGTDDFLTYSAVIGQCYKLSGEGHLNRSVKYGRSAGLLDKNNKLSAFGSLVGNIILRKYDCN